MGKHGQRKSRVCLVFVTPYVTHNVMGYVSEMLQHRCHGKVMANDFVDGRMWKKEDAGQVMPLYEIKLAGVLGDF